MPTRKDAMQRSIEAGDPVTWIGQDGQRKSGQVVNLLPDGKAMVKRPELRGDDALTTLRLSKLQLGTVPIAPVKARPPRGKILQLNVGSALDDILEVREGFVEDKNTFWADLSIIDDNRFQPRDLITDEDEIEMRDSLNRFGQLQAAYGRRNPDNLDRIELCDGHRRKGGVSRGGNAGIKLSNPEQYQGKLFVTIRELTDREMLNNAVEANEARKDHNAMELARAYSKLRQMASEELAAAGIKLLGEPDADGKPQASLKQAAELNGKEQRQFTRLIKLLELDPVVQKAIADPANEIGERHGRELVRLSVDPEHAKDAAQVARYKKAQRQVLGTVLRHGLNSQKTAELVSVVRDILYQRDATLLDDDIDAAFVKLNEARRATTQVDNRAAVAAGTAHLSDVNAASTASSAVDPYPGTPLADMPASTASVAPPAATGGASRSTGSRSVTVGAPSSETTMADGAEDVAPANHTGQAKLYQVAAGLQCAQTALSEYATLTPDDIPRWVEIQRLMEGFATEYNRIQVSARRFKATES